MTALATATSTVLDDLDTIYGAEWPPHVRECLYVPPWRSDGLPLRDAIAAMDAGAYEWPETLVPLAAVDEVSIACVAVEDTPELGVDAGMVVRWFLSDVPPGRQGAVLDVDPVLYLTSLEEELRHRQDGLDLVLTQIGPAYQETYLDNEKRPRDFIVRPVRIACQNVIVGLAAIAQEAAFDGLSVVAWQTCEVPHVATHEANRALAALMLADAFKNGGTMEIRFDRRAEVVSGGKVIPIDGHPERVVPASLRRFGRTVGVILGAEDHAAITPAEARELFLAITPMPDGLRSRVNDAIHRRGITPERLCFTLLSQTWREIELDFMLACSDRTGSILGGGADWRERTARQAEMDVTRTALMAGMLFRRLNGHDPAGTAGDVRVVEDASVGVEWNVLEELGAVHYVGTNKGSPVPWMQGPVQLLGTELIVFFRSQLSDTVAARVNEMHAGGTPVAVAVPLDVEIHHDRLSAPILRCPDRMADLDKQAEEKLLTSRISRA